MPLPAKLLVYFAVLSPCLLYMWLAFKERPKISSLADFFPLTRFLEGSAYSRSTVSAGVSLATVILTLINLAPFLGLSLFVTIVSYALSFAILRSGAARILSANPGNDTLQGWLGSAYGSSGVRITALVFSFVGYVSIFSMELLVGVTFLEPFLGKGVLAFSFIYLVFMVAYSIIGGFRAIVATEQWQFCFVVAAVFVLVALVPLLAFGGGRNVALAEATIGLFGKWSASWSFVLGIICMNIPAPFADAATWQRLCATRSLQDARRGLGRAIPWFIFIWGGLILCASLISEIAARSGEFDPAKGTLMTFLVSTLAQGDGVHLALLFLFILGLFSAMITTADSLLLVSAQMFTQDFRLIHVDPQHLSDAHGMRVARTSLAIIALLSFGLFALFQWMSFDVVQLIFAIYGAHIALFPAVIAPLFFAGRMQMRKAAPAAWISTAVGFLSGWGSALYGKTTGQTDWLYNAPAIALIASISVFLFISLPAWKRVGRPLEVPRGASRQ